MGQESATTACMTLPLLSLTIRISLPHESLTLSVLPYWWVFSATMWSALVLHQPQLPSLTPAEYQVALPPLNTFRLSTFEAGAANTAMAATATKITIRENIFWVVKAYGDKLQALRKKFRMSDFICSQIFASRKGGTFIIYFVCIFMRYMYRQHPENWRSVQIHRWQVPRKRLKAIKLHIFITNRPIDWSTGYSILLPLLVRDAVFTK